MKRWMIGLLCATSLAGAGTVRPSDPNATEGVRQVLARLQAIQGRGILFGHQDTLAYGIGWRGAEFDSDVARVTGDFPAVMGWDVGHIGDPNNIDGVPFDHMQRWMRLAHARGALNTISWHMRVPGTEENAWTRRRVVETILPGGAQHTAYLAKLDALATFLETLTDAQGRPIPVIFRPFHEHMGSWFWWGRDFCTVQQYRRLFRFTVETLRRRGLHNLLICFSPNSFDSPEQYLERYPGDDVVDIFGLDHYFRAEDRGLDRQVQTMLGHLATLADEHGKLMAFSETGLEALPQADWWTSVLLANLKGSPAARRVSYVLVWRNGRPDHFYAPYPGQASAEDFRRFVADPLITLLSDWRRVQP